MMHALRCEDASYALSGWLARFAHGLIRARAFLYLYPISRVHVYSTITFLAVVTAS